MADAATWKKHVATCVRGDLRWWEYGEAVEAATELAPLKLASVVRRMFVSSDVGHEPVVLGGAHRTTSP